MPDTASAAPYTFLGLADYMQRDGSRPKIRTHQVEAAFSFVFDYLDSLRVYAKIAFNCLAALKGQNFTLSEVFTDIRNAVLSGENISRLVWFATGPSLIPESLRGFPVRFPLGSRCHSTVFLQKDSFLYGIVSLYGVNRSAT